MGEVATMRVLLSMCMGAAFTDVKSLRCLLLWLVLMLMLLLLLLPDRCYGRTCSVHG